MLTRQDRTVEDARKVFASLAGVGLTHVGFKDVGIEEAELAALHRDIKEAGCTSYLEVVSTSPEAALKSARVAVELGVDCLLGGTEVDAFLALSRQSQTKVFPFPGRPIGHPTKLGGTPQQVEAQSRVFLAAGCAGVDLLAYRATEAEPLDLVRAARAGLGNSGRLIVAGSIDSPKRIAAIKAAGADAFTIGSAAFDGSFSPTKGALVSQLGDILQAAEG